MTNPLCPKTERERDEALARCERAERELADLREWKNWSMAGAEGTTIEEVRGERDEARHERDQQERFKWLANRRADAAEAELERCHGALRETKIRSRYAHTTLRDAAYRITDKEQRGKVEQAMERLAEIDQIASLDPT